MNASVTPASSPGRQPGQAGVTLIVAVLLTGIVLLLIVGVTATLALGSRQGNADERQSYKALSAAESGLNTLPVRSRERMKTNPYTATDWAGTKQWLTQNSWADYVTPSGKATFTFHLKASDATSYTFDVESTGKVAASGVERRVVQTFTLKKGGLPPNLRLRSALTSLPRIDANGNAIITGTANSGVVTKLTAETKPNAEQINSKTFPFTVEDTSNILPGDYLKVNGTTLRVNSKTATTLNVTVVPANAQVPTSFGTGADVTLLLNAVAQTYSSVSTPMTIKASNFLDLVPGEEVTIAGKKAIVSQEKDANGKVVGVSFNWTNGAPLTLAEGTPILRDVTAMRSAENIDPKRNKLEHYTMDGAQDCTTATNCRGANDDVLEALMAQAGSDRNQKFFTDYLLGITDDQLNELLPLSNSTQPLTTNEIRRIPAANFDEVIKNGNSTGILIVDGDINSNVNGNTTFNGLIYFRGNQGGKFNGNLTVNGAIAVRGGPIEGLTTDDVATDITGSLEIKYDAVKLRKLMLNATGGLPQFKADPSTWRQR